jgi:hypothetical protein
MNVTVSAGAVNDSLGVQRLRHMATNKSISSDYDYL